MPVINGSAVAANRVKAIREYHESTGVERAQVDVSGGIDSAVILALCVQALGQDMVTAVHSRIHTSTDATSRAKESAESLKVRLVIDELTDEFETRIRNMKDNLIKAGYSLETIERRIAADPTTSYLHNEH